MESNENTEIVNVPRSMVDKLRRFLRDSPELNELQQGYESSDDFYAEMIVDAVSEFNFIPPAANSLMVDEHRLGYLTRSMRKVLIDLAAARALLSVTIFMQRNQISVEGGNITENLHDKWQSYRGSIQTLLTGPNGSGAGGAVTAAEQYKLMLNARGAWGSVPSQLIYCAFPFTTNFVPVYG